MVPWGTGFKGETVEDGLDEQAKIAAQRAEEARITGGYKDNPKAGEVAAVVEEFKAVLAQANPPNLKAQQTFLDEVATLAALRNTLTRVEKGADCHERVTDAGFLIHTKDHKNLNDHGKKGYVLQTIDAVIDGLLQVAAQMTDKAKQVPEFMQVFTSACIEAKGENIQFWLAREAGIVKASRSDESHDLAHSITAEFKHLADLRARLTPDQVQAATTRLDEAIAHAEKLKEAGYVVSTEDWGRKYVQRMVAGGKPKGLPQVGGQSPKSTEFAKKVKGSVADHSVPLFRRDLLPYIAKPGWFEG